MYVVATINKNPLYLSKDNILTLDPSVLWSHNHSGILLFKNVNFVGVEFKSLWSIFNTKNTQSMYILIT